MAIDDFQEEFRNDFKDEPDKDYSDFNFERKPANDSYDTFRLRTDPSDLIKKIELQLRNQIEKVAKDGKIIYINIPNTKALCNEQGIQHILQRIKSVVNNHTVQGNQHNLEEHRLRLREIADSLTIFFWSNHVLWELEENKVNGLIDSIYFLIDLFLTRTLDNKERELYGETFKETTNREVSTEKSKGGFIDKTLKSLIAR